MSIMTQSNSNPFESKVRDDKYLKFEKRIITKNYKGTK